MRQTHKCMRSLCPNPVAHAGDYCCPACKDADRWRYSQPAAVRLDKWSDGHIARPAYNRKRSVDNRT